MAEWSSLNKIVFCGISVPIITNSEIACLIEIDHWGRNDGYVEVGVEELDFLLEAIGEGDVVAIHAGAVLCVGVLEAVVESVVKPHVVLVADEDELVGVAIDVLLGNFEGVVDGAVVAHDDFEALVGLGKERVEGFGQRGGTVVDAH